MIEFRQTRISSMSAHLTDSLVNQEVIVGIRADQTTNEILEQLGFKLPLTIGDSILPNGNGRVCKFNSLGKDVPRRDQPMETVYREMEFTRMEWHGADRVEVTGCVWIPYKRYPRENIPAPETRMNVVQSNDGTLMIVSDYTICSPDNYETLKHTVNLYLEIFGYCFLMPRNQNPIPIPRLLRLNWNLLPPGEYPWDRIEEQVKVSMVRQAPKALAAALKRFELINSLNPTFRAVGNGGYRGYLVFGFEDINLYVLENQMPNNAIYVFNQDWQSLSQLTKAQILQGNLHQNRIVHRENWFRELRLALGK